MAYIYVLSNFPKDRAPDGCFKIGMRVVGNNCGGGLKSYYKEYGSNVRVVYKTKGVFNTITAAIVTERLLGHLKEHDDITQYRGLNGKSRKWFIGDPQVAIAFLRRYEMACDECDECGVQHYKMCDACDMTEDCAHKRAMCRCVYRLRELSEYHLGTYYGEDRREYNGLFYYTEKAKELCDAGLEPTTNALAALFVKSSMELYLEGSTGKSSLCNRFQDGCSEQDRREMDRTAPRVAGLLNADVFEVETLYELYALKLALSHCLLDAHDDIGDPEFHELVVGLCWRLDDCLGNANGLPQSLPENRNVRLARYIVGRGPFLRVACECAAEV
jgi:hypothetical protein